VAALDTGHASDPNYANTACSHMTMTCSAELVNRRAREADDNRYRLSYTVGDVLHHHFKSTTKSSPVLSKRAHPTAPYTPIHSQRYSLYTAYILGSNQSRWSLLLFYDPLELLLHHYERVSPTCLPLGPSTPSPSCLMATM